jgi:hypothetical protein
MSFFFRLLQQPNTQATAIQPSVAILVFKTSIRSIRDIKIVEEAIGKLDGLIRWNVDREDIDNVLRIETIRPDTDRVIHLVREAGYFCEELPD